MKLVIGKPQNQIKMITSIVKFDPSFLRSQPHEYVQTGYLASEIHPLQPIYRGKHRRV